MIKTIYNYIIRVIKTRRLRWAGRGERMGHGGGEVQVGFWWEDLMEREPPGKPTRRCEDNIKMDLQYEGWEHGLDSFGCG